MHGPVYEFFRDQGSIIAGLLALAAGIIAYIGAIRAANRQVAALKDQIEDNRTARRLVDERRLSVIKWAIRAEGTRLHAAVLALRRALPREPRQPTGRSAEQLIIESSPVLRGEREEMALLDDQTRAALEKVAGIVAKYNLGIQTAQIVYPPEPQIGQDILDLVDRLAAAVEELRSIP